jgi:hypothetical protein
LPAISVFRVNQKDRLKKTEYPMQDLVEKKLKKNLETRS